MQSICIIYGEGDIVLFSFKDTVKSKLTWYLAGCVLLSGMIAGIVGYVFFYFGTGYVEDVFDDQEVNKTWQLRYLDDLQEYINKNAITVDNIEKLREWTEDNSYVYLSVYQNQQVIFNSDYAYVVPATEAYILEETQEDINDGEIREADIEEGAAGDEFESNETEYFYKLSLTDGSVASADIFCYDYWKYQYYVSALALVLGVCLFVIILTRLINRKIRYINNMAKELQILEGGNLEYPITIKGKDELANLARGIEQMRLSIIDNIEKEHQMLQGNKDLVTSMSHDLRTPLTTLTGYLEILTMGNVTDEDKRRHYLELSLAKSQEIKQLSDDLFEYFLIYAENDKRLQLEPVPAAMLVDDLISNQFLGLEEEGYEIVGINHVSPEDGNCMINIKYMQRVLNNLTSNLEKYADKEEPIEISANLEQRYLVLKIRNKIRGNIEPHESTKIGLITCERIMKLHHGEFKKFESEGDFIVKLVIPME